jgi:tetratricopeptide (TPR) repeat protein
MANLSLEKGVVPSLIPVLACLLLLVNPAFAGNDASVSTGGGTQSTDQLSSSKQYYVHGLKEADNKNYSEAVKYYSQALNLNPHYGEAYGNRGAARFNLKDYNGALSDYNAALKIFPENKALLDLKAQAEGVLRANAGASHPQNQAEGQANLSNQIRAQTMLGGDLADPSTIIMMNAQRRGLITQPAVDYSDPASIIMMNARKRGLIPAAPTP